MGRPVELPSPAADVAAAATSSSEGEESEGEEAEGWVHPGGSDDEDGAWPDPTGGVLSQVGGCGRGKEASALHASTCTRRVGQTARSRITPSLRRLSPLAGV